MINPETPAQCRFVDEGNTLWIGDVQADLAASEQAITDGQYEKAMQLANRARGNALEMQEEQVETGYELEHLARQIIARLQQGNE